MFGDEKKKKRRGKTFSMRTPARKAKNTTAPKMGRSKSIGHSMGGLFGVTPKKPEPDMPPRTRAAEGRSRQARMKRLDGKLI